MVWVLKECCCGCTLKIGTILIAVTYIVSEHLLTVLLTAYRNGSYLSQEQKSLKLNKLQFTRVAKVLAKSIQITFEQSTAIIAHCIKARERKHEFQKEYNYIIIHLTRCQQDSGDCGRLKYPCFATHITVNKGD